MIARTLLLAVTYLGLLSNGSAAERPNIVFIVADDLGYGDLGCYGQTKIRTPTLDRLAKEGLRLTRHYSGNAVCAPSRCVLMTGRHPGHAYIRDNRELKPEGQFPLPEDTVTIAKLLQANGYTTGAFGKWGLGGPGTSGEPLKQGFDRFFGYNCQRVAHNYYPPHLWDNGTKKMLRNAGFPSNDKLKPDEDPAKPESYTRFIDKDYAPDLIAEQVLAFVDSNKDKPFFLFWPTTVPHLALQVPDDSQKEYAGKWDDPPYPGGKGYLPHYQPRAAYAAMVTRMDREIGRLMDRLAMHKLDKNTIVIFSSDNGPLYDKLGGTDCDFFNSHGGLRGRKGSLYEGGFRVPGIVHWPGKIAAGQTSDRVSGFEDWLPTLLEIAAIKHPATPIDGISFAPTLRGQPQQERPFLYREFPGYGGQQSLHMGEWKAVRQKINAKKVLKTELYNLKRDPLESTDVAKDHPDVVAKMEAVLKDQHTPSKEFPFAVPLDR